jgi:hypothetical protein
MNPAVLRAAILVTELMVFFMVTAFTAYFISHASALRFAAGDAPPARFPVIAYDGDRAQPDPGNYLVVPWNEWEAAAGKRPGASLLLPERAATIKIGEAGEASFTLIDQAESRQTVELTVRTAGGEQHVRYVARPGAVEARYMRTLGTQTLLMGAAAGFVAGLIAGRVLRRRLLTRQGYIVPTSPR